MDSAVLIQVGHLAIWVLAASLVVALAGAALWHRARTERQLAVSDALRGFALLVERSADPIVIIDAVGAVSYANPAVERVFGYQLPTLVSNVLDLVHPDEVAEATERLAGAADGGASDVVVLRRLRHADGRWLWCETSSSNLLHEPSVGGVVMVLRDVTARRAAEATAEVQHRLTEMVLATTTALVVTTSMDGRIESINRAAEQLIGRTAEEVRGMRAAEFVPEDERVFAEGPIDPDRLPATMENHWTHVSGRRYRVAWRNAVLYDVDGRPASIVATGTDVTAERRAQDTARRAEQRRHELLTHEATHDVLTGLLNRAGLLRELEQQLEGGVAGAPMAVLFLDLDGFKAVNDTYGHQVGDTVLAVVAERLGDQVRESDAVGRLGGDEFVLLCPGLDPAAASTAAERIERALAEPITVDGLLLRTGASVGVVLAQGGDADEVLREADAAMYVVKRSRRRDREAEAAPQTDDAAFPFDVNEARRLEVLRRLGLLDSDADPFVDTIVRLAAEVCGVPIAAVSLIDADRQWFKSSIGLAVAETPRSMAFCAHTILESGALFVVPDARHDERFEANPLVTGDPNIRYYAGAPITIGGEATIGSLCVIDRDPRHLDEHQQAMLLRLRDSLVTYLELTAPDPSGSDPSGSDRDPVADVLAALSVG